MSNEENIENPLSSWFKSMSGSHVALGQRGFGANWHSFPAEKPGEAAKKSNGGTPRKAMEGLLPAVFTVKRIGPDEAIEQFAAFREGKSIGIMI
jgi:hypothetical protein